MNITNSESVDVILPALLRARQKFGPLHKSGQNTYLKSRYVVLDDLLDAVTPALEAEGIIVVQGIGAGVAPLVIPALATVNKTDSITELGYASVSVTTRLWHVTSGQWIEATAIGYFSEEKGISFVQAQGKVITYLRRYQLTALTGIATEDDDDAQRGGVQAQPKSVPVARQAADGLTGGEFGRQWRTLFDGDDEARARLNEVLGDKSWSDVKGDANWLTKTLSDETVAVALRREKKRADDLAAAGSEAE